MKDDIESWLKKLQSKDIVDWLVVVVENYDGKRTNKLLPRTTVLDKIRADFAPKQGDRCISVINPGKPESRSAESWRGLVARIRHLLLVAYNKAITKLEDYVRQQRERRNESGWNFMQYFALQVKKFFSHINFFLNLLLSQPNIQVFFYSNNSYLKLLIIYLFLCSRQLIHLSIYSVKHWSLIL